MLHDKFRMEQVKQPINTQLMEVAKLEQNILISGLQRGLQRMTHFAITIKNYPRIFRTFIEEEATFIDN